MTGGVTGGGLAGRRLVPEILDALAADDPRARRSRGDLRRINAVMRHAAIADALVARHLAAPRGGTLRVLDLGAGDGHATLRLARRLARRHPRADLTLLDRAPAVAPATLELLGAVGWDARVAAVDVFDWLAAADGRYDLVVTNLFLHHFDGAPLARLLALIAPRADLFVATEPLRTAPSLLASRLVGLIGANDVTRHDAPASVQAGFRDGELGALWPQVPGGWVSEGPRAPFTHAFAAGRGRA